MRQDQQGKRPLSESKAGGKEQEAGEQLHHFLRKISAMIPSGALEGSPSGCPSPRAGALALMPLMGPGAGAHPPVPWCSVKSPELKQDPGYEAPIL